MATNEWSAGLKKFLSLSVLIMFALGFFAGIPILLIFSTLSLWLREAGVERDAVTFFSWAALGYSFKFTWAPLVDRLPIPYLTAKLGRRRSWLLLSQFFITLAIFLIGNTDPSTSEESLKFMALAAVLLGFSSATQDIGVDAYRIESDSTDMQATLSATYIAGYRLGMILAGAGALFMATYFGAVEGTYNYPAWKLTYYVMAAVMFCGMVITLIIPEPKTAKDVSKEFKTSSYVRFFGFFLIVATVFALSFFYSDVWLSPIHNGLVSVLGNVLGGFLSETLRLGVAIGIAVAIAMLTFKVGVVDRPMAVKIYVDPIKDFFDRYGKSTAILLLALVGLYRISDIVLGVVSNVFYQDMGFSKNDIATVVKTYGLIMSLVGGFLGGLLTVRFKLIHVLMWGAILSAATNLLFLLLSKSNGNLAMFYVVISADNLAAGLASAAFVAFLSSLTNISFTAVQYAIFTSLMTLLPKFIGGYSGTISTAIGYPGFFTVTALMGIPVIYIVWLAGRKLT
ncbi:MAG: MFS transporter [Bdellovibrionales bacterium]|nr:MFS transporter [Bdellovibrionales bacterium]